MPKLSDMQNIDRSRLMPVSAGAAAVMRNTPMPAAPHELGQPSPLFMSAMPLALSSYDQFARQFYGRAPVPMQRIFLP